MNHIELWMALVEWVDKVLNLSHLELSDSEKTLSGMDLVSETHTQLGSGAWHLSVVEFEQSSEVEEDTLGSLWSEISLQLTGWSDLTCEHEVESLSLRQVVAALRGLHAVLLDTRIELLLLVFTTVSQYGIVYFPFFWFQVLLLGQSFGDVIFNQLVSSVALSVFDVLDHEVSEFVDVAL